LRLIYKYFCTDFYLNGIGRYCECKVLNFSHVNGMVSYVYERIIIELKLYQITFGRDVTFGFKDFVFKGYYRLGE